MNLYIHLPRKSCHRTTGCHKLNCVYMKIGNRVYQSRVHTVEMSYLRGACGVTRWEGEINESVYERCGMGTCGSEVWNGGMSEKIH